MEDLHVFRIERHQGGRPYFRKRLVVVNRGLEVAHIIVEFFYPHDQ